MNAYRKVLEWEKLDDVPKVENAVIEMFKAQVDSGYLVMTVVKATQWSRSSERDVELDETISVSTVFVPHS